MILHIPPITPNSCFDEVHFELLLPFELNRKPSIITIKLIKKFKERTFFENFIAVLILNMSQHLEKLKIFNLRISYDIPKCVSESGFNFQERLKSYLVDFLKTLAIEMSKILYFELFNQLFTCFRQEKFSQSTISIDFANFVIQLFLDQLVNCILSYHITLVKTFNNSRLVLSL